MTTRFFVVRGTWPFPYDMLRYDACFPQSETDSGKLERLATMNAATGEIEIALMSNSPNSPTRQRWQAHLWHVL